METAFDWISVLLFAGIALTFLQRSVKPPNFPDPALSYLPPTLGCAVGNWFGNEGYPLIAMTILVAAVGWFLHFNRPFRK